mmetsp:Transcript_40427/g.126510  ORF Transcript_40427/g.126510 Transcript_40427/m.126510 type:complete len:97 (+) Transcript_40427:256-546(+)
MEELQRAPVVPPESANIILSTVHKAKGLEWDDVFLAADLGELKAAAQEVPDFGPMPVSIEEINIVYVAATRARRRLHLNADLRRATLEGTLWMPQL